MKSDAPQPQPYLEPSLARSLVARVMMLTLAAVIAALLSLSGSRPTEMVAWGVVAIGSLVLAVWHAVALARR